MTTRTSSETDIEYALRRYEANETSRQLEVLATRVGQIAEQVIIHGQSDARLADHIADLRAEIKDMHGEISEIREYANKWRGGFYAIAAMGGMLGAIIAFWDKVRAVWGH